MKVLSACICISMLVVCTMAVSQSTVPVYFWSGQQYFGNDNNGHATASHMDVNDFRGILTSLAGASQQSSFVNTNNAAIPEVVVAFVNDYTPEGTSTRPSALKAALAGSVSSLAVPSLSLSTDSTSDILSQSFSSVQQFQLEARECTNIIAAVDVSAFVNGKPDLLLVRSSDSAVTEACLSVITNAVSQRTGGQYAALLSTDRSPAGAAAAETLLQVAAARMYLQDVVIDESSSATNNTTSASTCIDDFGQTCDGVVYVTPGIFIGLLIVAFLLVILFVGICATMSIQAPLRFASPNQKLVIGKEY